MSDSYLNFNSNKNQFTIVHVTYQEKKKVEKTIDLQNKILLNDTIEDVLNKIAIKSKLITGDFIYAWMEHKKQIYPLFVSYDKINLINPYLEKTYDEHFVYDDGTKKQDYQQTLHSFQIIESFINQNKLTDLNIYFCDALSYNESLKKSLKSFTEEPLLQELIFYGIIQKYFPSIPSYDWINDLSLVKSKRSYIEYNLSINNKINSVIDENYEELKRSLYKKDKLIWSPNTLLYSNTLSENINSINLYQLFHNLKLQEDIPCIRIHIDSYLDACSKLLKSSISTNIYPSKEKFVSKRLFEQWTKNISIENGFNYPTRIDKTNTVSIIISDSQFLYYVTMLIHLDGLVEVYFENKNKISPMSPDLIDEMITKCNSILETINYNNLYSEYNQSLINIQPYPQLINCNYSINISQYNV